MHFASNSQGASRFLLALLGMLSASSSLARGQQSTTHDTSVITQSARQSDSGLALGLTAAAALGIHAGLVRLERGIDAYEGGVSLDLGHFSSRKLRLTTEITYTRSSPHTERIETEGKTYRATIFDLSGEINLALLTREPTKRIVPFVAGGVGMHVLSSAFGSLAIDTRYNTNNFSLQVESGVRFRLGRRSRRALLMSVRRVQSNDVSRTTVQIGLEALFNDLARASQ
ncbi:MAG: hypothetical protein ABIT38_00870 [Gemmatimonadaceae bacterium]